MNYINIIKQIIQYVAKPTAAKTKQFVILEQHFNQSFVGLLKNVIRFYDKKPLITFKNDLNVANEQEIYEFWQRVIIILSQ